MARSHCGVCTSSAIKPSIKRREIECNADELCSHWLRAEVAERLWSRISSFLGRIREEKSVRSMRWDRSALGGYICGKHFISVRPSKNPKDPYYIPNTFSFSPAASLNRNIPINRRNGRQKDGAAKRKSLELYGHIKHFHILIFPITLTHIPNEIFTTCALHTHKHFEPGLCT